MAKQRAGEGLVVPGHPSYEPETVPLERVLLGNLLGGYSSEVDEPRRTGGGGTGWIAT